MSLNQTAKKRCYSYDTDPDLTKPLPRSERDVRLTVEDALRDVARSFKPHEVHTTRFAAAGSAAILDALKSFRDGWSYGNGVSDDEDEAAED